MKKYIIDTHTHLNLIDYENDLNEVINNSISNDVLKMIVVGIDVNSSKEAIFLARKYNELIPTAGIHPSEVEHADINELEELVKNNKVYAIGECGIDLYWVKDNLDIQKEVFIKQIKLAIKYDLPLIIHIRDSFDEVYECLLPFKGQVKGVLHCFSSTLENAYKTIDLGFYLGIGGVVTFKNALESKEIVKKVDLKHFLLETDCPYLAPTPYRGKRNEPKYLEYIVSEIAKIKGVTIDEVMDQTTNNAVKLFKLEDVI